MWLLSADADDWNAHDLDSDPAHLRNNGFLWGVPAYLLECVTFCIGQSLYHFRP